MYNFIFGHYPGSNLIQDSQLKRVSDISSEIYYYTFNNHLKAPVRGFLETKLPSQPKFLAYLIHQLSRILTLIMTLRRREGYHQLL